MGRLISVGLDFAGIVGGVVVLAGAYLLHPGLAVILVGLLLVAAAVVGSMHT